MRENDLFIIKVNNVLFFVIVFNLLKLCQLRVLLKMISFELNRN